MTRPDRYVPSVLVLLAVATPPSGVALAQTATAPAAAQRVPVPSVIYDTDLLPPAFHRSRRDAVRAALPNDAIAFFFGAPEHTRQNDVSFEYRQDSDLLYLTGAREPGTVLALAPGGIALDGATVTEVLFVPPRNPSMEVWTGRRLGPEGAVAQLGVDAAVSNERFAEVMRPLLESGRPIYHLGLPEGVEAGSELAAQVALFRERAGPSEPSVRVEPAPDGRVLRRLLDSLRTIKTEDELRALGRAIDITADAHREVARSLEPGMHEYEAEALIEYVFKREGAEYTGFPSIVGSGENSVILHYESNRKAMSAGEVVVVDIGAEYHGYSADVTRTYPVSGTFSDEQRAIYELVLKAQEAAIARVRTGNAFQDPHRAAAVTLAEGLAELGLIGSATDYRGLGRFFMHGTSHYLGLDVHDVGTGGALEPGTVITVEPGLYIAPADDIHPRWWNIGVRIEDDVLVTDGDPVVLSAGAPRSVDEIEALMSGTGTGNRPPGR